MMTCDVGQPQRIRTLAMTETPATSPAPTPKAAKPAAKKAAAKAAESAALPFEDSLKAFKDQFTAFALDTADFKIATEESAKLLDQARGAAVDSLAALSREVSEYFEKYAVTTNDSLKALLAAKSPMEAVEVENRYVMDAASLYVAHLQRLHAIGVEAVIKAWEPLTDGASAFTWWKKAA